ncbi:SDR family NAD(P)-dependent oxidoreductase [Aminobacter carboxidus]|uniref:SDR family oxidoreductase n=1 Tax=Aminobacter carboxidus TaxID=376165 RepID=A0ABR9GK59_9HYPH|nr:SDR family NAD(P)-dependent oxidoreductase [Aminobacter carboxidus]MBE1204054.1 SDR family oxidoreductase [Aminobacter carboxidus]
MSAPAIRFDGKRVLVTGGASGIGETVAKLLSDLGARVVIADLNREQLDPAAQRVGAAGVAQGDVASEADAERMAGEAIAVLGGLDLVFNSAGIGDDLVPVHEQSVERWQRVIDVNLRGTYLMCRATSRPMLAQKRGAIVNVSSIVGLGGFPRRSAYAAAKAGINHLTQTLACEWGPSGIRVNAIAPAYTRTPMVQALLERKALDPTILERRTPLGRLALPEEMAKASVFLLSDWASYITGTVLPVDGGWSAFGGAGDVATA